MNKNSKVSLFVLFLLVVGFSSCLKRNDFQDEPQIEYLDFVKYQNTQGKDSIGVLKFKFTDGDGDIGLDQQDTFPPFDTSSVYYYNFYVKYFEKQNGEFVEVILAQPNNSRIPNITPEGQNKTLEGEIDIALYINNPLSNYDTIKFEAYIFDRALHQSNTIETPEIVVVK